MLRFDWVKKTGEVLQAVVRQNQGFARKNEIWRSPTSLTLLEQKKSWRTPKDLANTDFLANPYLAKPSFSTIKNRALAKPYFLANPYSGELLRSRSEVTIITRLASNCSRMSKQKRKFLTVMDPFSPKIISKLLVKRDAQRRDTIRNLLSR